MSDKILKILIADDDYDDRFLTKEAFLEAKLAYDVDFVDDGEQLFDYLNGQKELPELILLDLNMPRKDGRLVLKEIKQHKGFCKIPVVIFTTSKTREDMNFTMEMGAERFFTKPSSFSELLTIVRELDQIITKLRPGRNKIAGELAN
jgi:two-component system, response regulator